MELPVVNEVHGKCIFRDAPAGVPRDAPMLISLDSTRAWTTTGSRTLRRRRGGEAHGAGARRPSGVLRAAFSLWGTHRDAVDA